MTPLMIVIMRIGLMIRSENSNSDSTDDSKDNNNKTNRSNPHTTRKDRPTSIVTVSTYVHVYA